MTNTWISETENDIEELQITHEDITERTPLRNKLRNSKGFKEKPRRKTGGVWTDERREKHKERMREVWRERKKEGRKEGRKEAVETNVVHSGLFDTKKINSFIYTTAPLGESWLAQQSSSILLHL